MYFLKFDPNPSEPERWFSYSRYTTIEIQLDESLHDAKRASLLEDLVRSLSILLGVNKETIRTRAVTGIQYIDVISEGITDDVLLTETSKVFGVDKEKISVSLLQ